MEAADLDTDGDIDLLFANSGDKRYWTPVENRVLLNRGDGTFADAPRQVFGKRLGTSRVIRVADLNADKAPTSSSDTSSAAAVHRRNRRADASHPGALQLGPGARGRRQRLEPRHQTSCKTCSTSLLYENDGNGSFVDVSAKRMPHYTNNYEFEPVDLDGDGYLDLVTINDGEVTENGRAEHVFRNDHNDGTGVLTANDDIFRAPRPWARSASTTTTPRTSLTTGARSSSRAPVPTPP